MDFMELIESRRSIRKFKDQDVSKEDLIQLVKAAQFAPSAGNRQPWHFYIVQDTSMKEKIAHDAYKQNWMLTASAFIIVCADILRSEERYADRGRNLYCIQDTAAAIQNILLCAKSMGLGSCWCGAFDEAAIMSILHLPNDMRPIAILPIGYPLENVAVSNRRAFDEIITFVEAE